MNKDLIIIIPVRAGSRRLKNKNILKIKNLPMFVYVALEHAHGSLDVLPHEIFPSQLETLRKVVDFLILTGVFKLFRLTHAAPQDIPLA